MNRRRLLKYSCVSVGVLVAGNFGVNSLLPKSSELPTVNQLVESLKQLEHKSVVSHGVWSVPHIFKHCRLSVEHSLVGYPEHKPEWFKDNIGKLAFSLFESRNAMTHNLSEEIPGCEVSDYDEFAYELFELINVLERFEANQADLHEHFAYGPLSKEQYGAAHVMHVLNHFDELEFL